MQSLLLSQTNSAGPSHAAQTNLQPQPLSQTIGAGPSHISQTIDISTIPFPRLPHGGRKYNLFFFYDIIFMIYNSTLDSKIK
jgi:hypothetical protein